jgi:DNA-binding response OmpR family regulator
MVQARHARVLLVESDRAAARALEQALAREGMDSIRVDSGQEAEVAVRSDRPGLVILDPRLGAEDGWQVYRNLRQHGVPIMLLVRKQDPAVAQLGLAVGATDCVVGDAPADEVVARARDLLHRLEPQPQPSLTFAGVSLDAGAGGAIVDGRKIRLTRTEYAVLAALVHAAGGVVSRDQLAAQASAHAGGLPLARSMEGHVRSLRRKLGDDAQHPRRLESVRGFGYRLIAPAAVSPSQLAVNAFDALAEPALIIDRQQRVVLMNAAAEQAVGQSREQVVGHLSCSAMLRCRASRHTIAGCPGLEVLEGPRERLTIGGCTASRLPGQAGYVLLQVRE